MYVRVCSHWSFKRGSHASTRTAHGMCCAVGSDGRLLLGKSGDENWISGCACWVRLLISGAWHMNVRRWHYVCVLVCTDKYIYGRTVKCARKGNETYTTPGRARFPASAIIWSGSNIICRYVYVWPMHVWHSERRGRYSKCWMPTKCGRCAQMVSARVAV